MPIWRNDPSGAMKEDTFSKNSPFDEIAKLVFEFSALISYVSRNFLFASFTENFHLQE